MNRVCYTFSILLVKSQDSLETISLTLWHVYTFQIKTYSQGSHT
ncbi:hypothetical protein CLU83_4595 [Flavobacterium sp. 1]|nr:hypothetical protein CLU83_4595 [Flavobacterium sp. 1]